MYWHAEWGGYPYKLMDQPIYWRHIMHIGRHSYRICKPADAPRYIRAGHWIIGDSRSANCMSSLCVLAVITLGTPCLLHIGHYSHAIYRLANIPWYIHSSHLSVASTELADMPSAICVLAAELLLYTSGPCRPIFLHYLEAARCLLLYSLQSYVHFTHPKS